MKLTPQIIEGNKAIAIWMGGKIGNGGTKKYPVFTNIPITFEGKTQTWTCSLKDIQYHGDWKWLMPVVEKIEKQFDCQVQMYRLRNSTGTYACRITGYKTESYSENKIESVWKAVVAFIKCNPSPLDATVKK